jgi:hypothetical protein
LWRVLIHYVEQAQARRDWKAVRRIAVDETSVRRGHRYVINVLDCYGAGLLLMAVAFENVAAADKRLKLIFGTQNKGARKAECKYQINITHLQQHRVWSFA